MDSGATHPLRPQRPGEDDNTFKKVAAVTLANGETTSLQVTPGGVMVTSRQDVEPILPMGQLVQDLGCEVNWKDGILQIFHPLPGQLPVKNQLGCPQLPRALALELIEEMEALRIQGRSKQAEVRRREEVDERLGRKPPCSSSSTAKNQKSTGG